MPTDYTLADLANLSGVSARTVRYYIQSGLLPAPLGAGPAARYTEAHLDRLRFIRKLQSAHLPLAEIRRRLESMPGDELAAASYAVAEEPAPNSALDYISSLLVPDDEQFAGPVRAMSLPEPRPMRVAPAPAVASPSSTSLNPSRDPDRAQWERISLDPDIEIHIRRPLSRLQNKRVERLISIARQLLEED
jgi:DNA-binding transcriptional MerR regulator